MKQRPRRDQIGRLKTIKWTLYGRIGREHARMPDPRGFPKGPRARDIVDPYLHLDAIKVKTRDFR